MSDERLIEIETKISHQEHTIETLNQVVLKQELLVYQLEAKIEKLIEQLEAEKESEKQQAVRNERPPHY